MAKFRGDSNSLDCCYGELSCLENIMHSVFSDNKAFGWYHYCGIHAMIKEGNNTVDKGSGVGKRGEEGPGWGRGGKEKRRGRGDEGGGEVL